MLKKKKEFGSYENHEINLRTNDVDFLIKWRTRIDHFITCGECGYELECHSLDNASVKIEVLNGNDRFYELTIGQMNAAYQIMLDLSCNCHGFTFANGKYGIDNAAIDKILEDEFVEVTPESIRLRKILLTENARKRAKNAKAATV